MINLAWYIELHERLYRRAEQRNDHERMRDCRERIARAERLLFALTANGSPII